MLTTRTLCVLLAVCLSLSGAAFVAGGGASAGDAGTGNPDAGDAGARPTVIDSCTTISSPGAYVLGDDIEIESSTTRPCIRIRASDVVLDGGGHVIEGKQVAVSRRSRILGGSNYRLGVGVAVTAPDGLANVTVLDLRVTEWETGIAFENVSHGRIRNVVAADNDGGIVLRGSPGSIVAETTVTGNEEDGLAVFQSSRAEVRRVEATGNGWAGVAVFRSNATTVADTSATGNRGDGIVVVNGSRHRLADVDTAGNAVGVFLLSVDDSTVARSSARGNSFAGMLLARAIDNTLTNVAVTNTTGTNRVFAEPSGLLLYDASGNRIENATVGNNERWAVYARNGSADNVMTDLTLTEGTLSVGVTDVALRTPESSPDSPEGVADVGPHVSATATGPGARLELRIGYDETAVAVDESALGVWRYRGDDWSEMNSTLDPDADAVDATVADLPVDGVTELALFGRNGSRVVTGTRVTPGRTAKVSVFLNCTFLSVTVTPADRVYTMDLTYLDTSTGERIRFLAGQLNGTVEDPFGDSGFVLLEVRVRLAGRWFAWHLPDACMPRSRTFL